MAALQLNHRRPSLHDESRNHGQQSRGDESLRVGVGAAAAATRRRHKVTSRRLQGCTGALGPPGSTGEKGEARGCACQSVSHGPVIVAHFERALGHSRAWEARRLPAGPLYQLVLCLRSKVLPLGDFGPNPRAKPMGVRTSLHGPAGGTPTRTANGRTRIPEAPLLYDARQARGPTGWQQQRGA